MAKISIITITYNAGKVLGKTMESILDQEDKNFEYILVDGASGDDTLDIITKYEAKIIRGDYPGFSPQNFRWVSEPDKGLYDAMNKGLQKASGDFVWFMNAGDKIYSRHTLSKIQNAWEKNPDADVIYGQSLIIDENDQPLGERHKIAPKILTGKSLLNGLVVCHQSILVRRTIASDYDLQYKVSADYDWTNKVLAKSQKNIYIDNYLSKFMVSGLSAVQRKRSWKERYDIMKKHFGLPLTLWAHLKIVVKYPFTRKY
ncbi:MAG: glycosyltransferase [Bacteroidales bacterium]|jgi:glycosyltransferase involved in cell wall biosynthesis|nr:glycosyltransferase [Bacteroidales bacterium]